MPVADGLPRGRRSVARGPRISCGRTSAPSCGKRSPRSHARRREYPPSASVPSSRRWHCAHGHLNEHHGSAGSVSCPRSRLLSASRTMGPFQIRMCVRRSHVRRNGHAREIAGAQGVQPCPSDLVFRARRWSVSLPTRSRGERRPVRAADRNIARPGGLRWVVELLRGSSVLPCRRASRRTGRNAGATRRCRIPDV